MLFVVGATLCALPCGRVARVTSIDETAADRWLSLDAFGHGGDASSEAPSRLLWLSASIGGDPLPISGACKLMMVHRRSILPLPPLHRRLTPFSALLDADGKAALLLEPARLARALSSPDRDPLLLRSP